MIVHAYYPLGETRVEREAQALVSNGYEVDVICLLHITDKAREEVVDGVQVYRQPIRRNKKRGMVGQFLEYIGFFLLAFFKVSRLHQKKKYGTVQAHNLPDFLIFATLWPKLTGARVILDLHDLMPEFYAGSFNRDLSYWAVRLVIWQERISCWFADHVITVTELWRQTLIGRGVPQDKISVVMNAADDNIFSAEVKTLRNGKVAGNGFDLIYHGTITYRYGIDLAIRAVGMVKDQIPNICLTIHGGGEFLAKARELVKELNLEEWVKFSTVFVPTNELPKLIMNADVGIVPYRRNIFTDGILPTKLMEYAALGIPALTIRTPVIEAYFNDEMVQFFEPENVEDLAQNILALHKDRKRLAVLASKIEEFNKRYRWSEIAKGYARLIDSLNKNLK